MRRHAAVASAMVAPPLMADLPDPMPSLSPCGVAVTGFSMSPHQAGRMWSIPPITPSASALISATTM